METQRRYCENYGRLLWFHYKNSKVIWSVLQGKPNLHFQEVSNAINNGPEFPGSAVQVMALSSSLLLNPTGNLDIFLGVDIKWTNMSAVLQGTNYRNKCNFTDVKIRRNLHLVSSHILMSMQLPNIVSQMINTYSCKWKRKCILQTHSSRVTYPWMLG
jgi:hypothetical protein